MKALMNGKQFIENTYINSGLNFRFLLLSAALFLAIPAFAQKPLVRYVNTLIGTAPSTTESARSHSEAGSELKGQTLPSVSVPNGMTQWTPQSRATETKCLAPYYYNDSLFQGFRGTHWLNGSCVKDYGSVTIMPVSGELTVIPEQRASPYVHAKEEATPDYYKVWLDRYNIGAEVTATARASVMRFSYTNDDEAFMVIEPNSDEGQGYIEVFPEKGEIVGYNPAYRIYQGSGQPAGISGYFVIKVDTKVMQYGTWQGETIKIMNKMGMGKGERLKMGAYIGFGAGKKVVTVKIGTSFTSIEGARRNLTTEVGEKSFEGIRSANQQIWNTALGKMAVKGNEYDKELFYSALYRTKLSPRIFSDVDGGYPSFAGGTPEQKAEGFQYYNDLSMWDTFRASLPLGNIIEPESAGDMMQSLVKMAEQGGWMPIFPCWNQYTAAMIGDHAISAIADAYVKKVRNFDVKTAYKYLRKNAFEVNADPKSYAAGKGRRALASYLKYGYVPLEDSVWQAFHKREQVSRTLEYAFDDFCLSKLATDLGEKQDAVDLQKRALNYKNVIDPATGYARGRYADGRWIQPFDPFAKRASFITEGSPAQYSWFVPQDVPGLVSLMGGKERFISKLDTLFEQGYYWHGNEPNHQISYLYTYGSQPWKTQRWVTQIRSDEYDTSPGGLSGNEDGGQMSAWLVFSMAGFYPVTPATPVYILGSPAFEEMKLKTAAGKTFKIEAKGLSEKARYIQSATLNGKPFTKTYLLHDQLLKGGTLVLIMGEQPNKKWGSGAEDVPGTH